ncbi:Oxidoreductase family, NAD-binding Rossmann fold [Mariniphaga anaerophila]|uniref:Oxidoreductase family, NAD-binding Rossmann fold n=1 Tax=Mariniphaga anaerophila TaxID=1484053 RepID=A0A1M4TJF3_9BACT|nr:Gfo/Idh/MocA family oxidoreductase [Mariniphaga anaerophila]SHE44632.1 Oxidoreductase family, NAD-binding Rossmann fold [Mariniphaga anaerophila]
MKTNRRKFFQIAGAAGAGVVSGGFASCSQQGSSTTESALASIKEAAGRRHPQQFNMCGYAAPKLETVRIGFVGLGNRGPGAVERMSNIEGVEITALCDKNPAGVERGQEILAKHGLPKAKEYTGSEEIWKEMCQSQDVDLVYICTPWSMHTPMAVFAMESGKHAATEVPAAVTVEEAWQLVETSERTKKHCMMLENCCYDFFELLTLNMARQGFFGEILHTEGAYIHDLMKNNFGKNSYSDMWRLKENQHRNGDLYPTHGLGPVCQILNVNRGDKMDYLTSMSSFDFSMAKHAAELAAEDSFWNEFKTNEYRGNMNTTMIRTTKGKTIMIQHDVSSPRPYSRIHLVSGTKGVAQKYPLPGKIAKGHSWFDADEMKVLEEQYTPKIVQLVGEMAKKVGGHGGMDFIMDWRLIDCLRNGIALDQDVYDAALWSVIAPLSEWSVANRSDSIDIPDFTNGAWQNNKPVDITLSQGGTTGVKVNAEAESQLSV